MNTSYDCINGRRQMLYRLQFRPEYDANCAKRIVKQNKILLSVLFNELQCALDYFVVKSIHIRMRRISDANFRTTLNINSILVGRHDNWDVIECSDAHAKGVIDGKNATLFADKYAIKICKLMTVPDFLGTRQCAYDL